MLILPPDQLRPGMLVGTPIIGMGSRVLLTTGQVLTERYIKRIQELRIARVCIDDQIGIKNSSRLVRPAVIEKATRLLTDTFEECARTGRLNIGPLQAEVEEIIDDLLTNSHLLVGMSDLKSYDAYTYQHSVNVTVLALTMGISSGYGRSQLQALGIGALLHDIGKIKIPVDILNKPASLSDEEYEIVKQHPQAGYDLLGHSSGIPPISAQVILMHHERYDGHGYPYHLPHRRIHEFGQVVAVADVYDALISDRPYRRGYSNLEAVGIIEKSTNTQLSPHCVDLLCKHINLYPCGSVVRLNTGDLALVTGENSRDYRLPQVKMLFDRQERIYARDLAIDLAATRKIAINHALPADEAEKTVGTYLSAFHELPHCSGQ